MKKLTNESKRKIAGGKTAPPPASCCLDPNESPTTNPISTYYHSVNGGCPMGGTIIGDGVTCWYTTTQYSCESGFNPFGFCGGA